MPWLLFCSSLSDSNGFDLHFVSVSAKPRSPGPRAPFHTRRLGFDLRFATVVAKRSSTGRTATFHTRCKDGCFFVCVCERKLDDLRFAFLFSLMSVATSCRYFQGYIPYYQEAADSHGKGEAKGSKERNSEYLGLHLRQAHYA